MSDEVYGGLNPIVAPAAADRIPAGTAPNAGGYPVRVYGTVAGDPGSLTINYGSATSSKV